MNQKKQKSLFGEQDLKREETMSPDLRRILLLFRNAVKEDDRNRAVRYFTRYGHQQADKNSPESLEQIIHFFREFRELRGAGRQYMEQSFFDVLRAYITTAHSILEPEGKPGMIVIDKKYPRKNNADTDKAFAIFIKATDFIEETINFRPTGRDVLDGGRKAMAVQTIETLLYCVKYPKLYDILLQVLLSKWKAAVLTALDLIYHNHIKNSKFKEALRLLLRSSKDEWIRYKAEGILRTWENCSFP